jgi:signal transduction histidine kinase
MAGSWARAPASERPVRHPAFRERRATSIRAARSACPSRCPRRSSACCCWRARRGPTTSRIDDLRFAATLAAQAAIAIGNALRLRRIVEMDRQRQEYLSNVSHELRSPLTVIQGYLEALASGAASEQAAHYLRVARSRPSGWAA